MFIFMLVRTYRVDLFYLQQKTKKFNNEEPSSEKKNTSTRIPMVIAKWKQTSKLDLRFEKDGKFAFTDSKHVCLDEML